ncbi:MAG TPA: hypothetical protein VNN10_09485 [Dehalococcoidia bacterium]|nr:hypothetical protein [Dehalococcoidia bacterium]
MTADLAISLPRRLTIGLSGLALTGGLASAVFVFYRFARDAYLTSRDEGLIDAGSPIPELAVPAGAGLVILAISAVLALSKPAWLPWLIRCVVAACAGVVASLAALSGETRAAAAFAGIAVWAWWTGGAVLLVLPAPALTSWPRAAVETGLGIALLSFLTLAVSLAAALTDATLLLILVLPVVLATTVRWRHGWRLWCPEDEEPPRPLEAFLEAAAVSLIAIALVVTFGVSLAPQTQFDALHYHFAMPRIFLWEGGFVERPDILQSYFPLGLEMAYVVAYWLGGEATMTLLHWLFAPLLAAALWAAGNALFGRGAGALAATVFLLAPLILSESFGASSDLAMTFWLLAAALALVLYTRSPSAGAAVFAGLCAGLALTFKIVSGLYILPLAGVFLVAVGWERRRLDLQAVRELVAFAAAGLTAGLPWLLIRLEQTGNPVFPLFNNAFKSERWPPVHERLDLWLFGIGHSASDLASVLWEISVHPWRFGQGIPTWSVGLPAMLVVCAVALLAPAARNRAQVLFLLLAAMSLLSWFFLSQYHRYGLPPFAMLAIVGSGGLLTILRRLPTPAAWAAATSLAALTFAGGLALTLLLVVPRPYPTDFLLGRESVDEFRDRTTAGYPTLLFLDEATAESGEGSAILGFAFNYFVRAPMYEWDLPPELSPFTRIVRSGLEGRDLARALTANNIRWLLVRTQPMFEGEPWPPDWLANSVLSPSFLSRHTEVAFEKYDVIVYRILEP